MIKKTIKQYMRDNSIQNPETAQRFNIGVTALIQHKARNTLIFSFDDFDLLVPQKYIYKKEELLNNEN